MQPPPSAGFEKRTVFGIDTEPLVKVQLKRRPLGENVSPGRLPRGGGGGLRRIVVPHTQPGRFNVRSTTGIICPVRTGPRLIEAEWALYEAFVAAVFFAAGFLAGVFFAGAFLDAALRVARFAPATESGIGGIWFPLPPPVMAVSQ